MSRICFTVPFSTAGDELVYVDGEILHGTAYRIDVIRDQCEILVPLKAGQKIEIFRQQKSANFTVSDKGGS